MNTTVNNPRPENMNAANVADYNNIAPKIEKISIYKYVGLLGFYGIGQAIATDKNGRKVANLFKDPERGYQAETPAMSYATEWHPTEAAALAALFASDEWGYFGNK